MKNKHWKKLTERLEIIKERLGQEFINDKCEKWAREYSLKVHHHDMNPNTFMQKQVNYIYMKFAYVYRDMKSGKY